MKIDPDQLGERRFLFISHRTPVDGDFSLNDLPGKGGRMDVIARAVTSSLLTSNGIRKDASATVFFGDSTGRHMLIVISGKNVRYLNPDERSAAGLLKGALEKARTSPSGLAGPGISFYNIQLADAFGQLSVGCHTYYLKEDGRRDTWIDLPALFVIGDSMDLTPEEEKALSVHSPERFALSPVSLHSDQCAVLVNWLIDSRTQERG